jgi:hypothetical protein
VRAGAGDAGEVDALGGRDARGDGGDLGAVGDRGAPAAGRAVAGDRALAVGGRRDLRAATGAGAELQPRDDLADHDGRALLGEDLGDRAGGGSGQLHVDLVGGDLDDGVAVVDVVADLDRPLQDGALGDGLPAGGRRDVHDLAGRVAGGGIGGRGCATPVAAAAVRRSAVAGADRDLGEHGAHLHGVALCGVDLHDGPARWRGHLRVDLVGRDLDEDLVRLDGVTFLLVPLQDGAFRHRLAHGGQGDLDRCGFDGHVCSFDSSVGWC